MKTAPDNSRIALETKLREADHISHGYAHIHQLASKNLMQSRAILTRFTWLSNGAAMATIVHEGLGIVMGHFLSSPVLPDLIAFT